MLADIVAYVRGGCRDAVVPGAAWEGSSERTDRGLGHDDTAVQTEGGVLQDAWASGPDPDPRAARAARALGRRAAGRGRARGLAHVPAAGRAAAGRCRGGPQARQLRA